MGVDTVGYWAAGGGFGGVGMGFAVLYPSYGLFNLLVQWHGWRADEAGFVELSIAESSL
jgi:hypothetical protein